jgi:hypothetical protein
VKYPLAIAYWWCASKALNTSGGRTHPEKSRIQVASEQRQRNAAEAS